MPTTVNGIGTSYYGKKDTASRQGTCQHCGAYVKLETYTTRLWFVIIFIPVIPLKRVRLLDFCPRCNRHWVVKPEEYEMSRQLAVSGAMEKYRAEPSVDAACALHAQFLNFYMHNEADKFRESAIQAHPDNVDLLQWLAAHLDQMGRTADSTPLYEKAHALQPEIPEVRFHLAWRRIGLSRLDEAYELLDYLRLPGAGQHHNVGLLETLAESYQKAGNHERVLELCGHLLRERPTIGDQHTFRKLVAKSERAVQPEKSLLPEQAFSVRGLFDGKSGRNPPWVARTAFWGSVALLFTLGMAGLNEYHRRHRMLTVVNGFADIASASIDGGPAVPVNPGSRALIPLSEGTHRISLSGPVTQTSEITLQSGYWTRWTSSPLWIYNIANVAAISKDVLHYAANPRPGESEVLSKEFSYVPHADYAFETPPNSMKVKGKNEEITKIHVGTEAVPPSSLFMGLRNSAEPNVALTFAEGHLKRNPRDTALLQIYAQNVVGEHEPRVAAFLKEGLWRKPISVPWHRAYQNLDSVAANEAALVPEYDAQLAQAPGDAMLLYLRGRVGLDRADQLKYYQLADAKDPQLGWPAMGLAFDAANRGDWGEAKRLCEKGAGPLSNDPSYRYLWHLVRLAVGEAGAQEPFYRQQIQSPDLVDALQTVYQLADCLAAQGKFNDARQAVNQWMANTGLARSPETVARFQSMLDYVCGDLDPVRLKNGNPPSLPTRDIDLLLARGEPDRVAKIDGFQTAFDGWSEMLSMSLAYSLVRNRVEADRWRGLACDKLRTGDGDMRRAADLLTRETPPTDAELDGIVLRLHEVPVFLCALAQKFPERKTELNQRAAKLNISRQAPYLLVKRAVGMP